MKILFNVVIWFVIVVWVGNVLGFVTDSQYIQTIQIGTYAIVLLLGAAQFSKKGTNQ